MQNLTTVLSFSLQLPGAIPGLLPVSSLDCSKRASGGGGKEGGHGTPLQLKRKLGNEQVREDVAPPWNSPGAYFLM